MIPRYLQLGAGFCCFFFVWNVLLACQAAFGTQYCMIFYGRVCVCVCVLSAQAKFHLIPIRLFFCTFFCLRFLAFGIVSYTWELIDFGTHFKFAWFPITIQNENFRSQSVFYSLSISPIRIKCKLIPDEITLQLRPLWIFTTLYIVQEIYWAHNSKNVEQPIWHFALQIMF